jgi:hypothetical protein
MLTFRERQAVESILFPGARWIVHEQPEFPWHRDRAKAPTAALVESSQALALDLFATVERLRSRNAIIDGWVEALTLPLEGPWTIEPEFLVPTSLLGEPRSTQVDAVACGARGLALFECKFTEPEGGSCSQPRPIARGPHKGLCQCNGRYEYQENPASRVSSRCALTAKGVRYWDLIPGVLNVDAELDHRPCPFAGGRYQWMRNLVASSALAKQRGVLAAFVIVYAEGPFPMAEHIDGRDWAQFMGMVRGIVPLRAVSYQDLLAWARATAISDDRQVVESLQAWILGKIAKVAGADD